MTDHQLMQQIAERRKDVEFMARIQAILEQEREVFERLA